VASNYINRGLFYSIESLSYINQTAIIGALAPYKKIKVYLKNLKLMVQLVLLVGASENNF
jgi:hypothetical protein